MSEFAGTLRERIAIEQLAPVRTASGLQQEEWVPVARCLAAIVAEAPGGEAEAMALSSAPRFRVTIRARDGVGVGQRLIWRERRMLVKQRIDDPRSPDRIVLRCEETR